MRLFVNREEFIANLPTHGIIAEVGVAKGIFSQEALLPTNPIKLCLIDCWDGCSGEVFEADYHDVVKKFAKNDNVEIIRGYSLDVAKQFPDRYFDWIYLDASHYYKDVLADLDAWHHKVKIGGVFAGHDYTKGTHHWIQVVEALEEWMPKNGYGELDYLTSENVLTCGCPPSWGLIVKS